MSQAVSVIIYVGVCERTCMYTCARVAKSSLLRHLCSKYKSQMTPNTHPHPRPHPTPHPPDQYPAQLLSPLLNGASDCSLLSPHPPPFTPPASAGPGPNMRLTGWVFNSLTLRNWWWWTSDWGGGGLRMQLVIILTQNMMQELANRKQCASAHDSAQHQDKQNIGADHKENVTA